MSTGRWGLELSDSGREARQRHGACGCSPGVSAVIG